MHRQILLILPFVLTGCAEPKFEFRGYTDFSSCAQIIDAELANGARFEGGHESYDPLMPGYVTMLSGEIFDVDVDIEVFCNDAGLIESVHYLADASDARETGAVFLRFGEGLASVFGEPTVIATDDSRSLRFLCHSPSPVLLDEWRLEPEEEQADDEEPPHEVYIAVMPRASECLDGSG